MSSFKEKSQVFLMGLMAGLIIAGTFFILKLDTYFKELNFYKNIAKTFTAAQKDNETIVKQEEELPKKERKTKETIVKNKTTESDTANKAKTSDFVLDADTVAKFTAMAKDTATVINSSSEEIVVRKDELLLTKSVELIHINEPLIQSTTKDSLLQKVSGIKEDKTTKQLINVELWHSPLNYKGYKMAKFKIILYGISSLEGLKIYKLGNQTFLKLGTLVYGLENTSEFKPYERITDENIISKLK